MTQNSITLNPPPLEVPGDFLADKQKAAFFNALINTLYQIWTTLYSIRSIVKVKTTDATATAILRVQIPNNTTTEIQAHVVARRNDGTSGASGDSAWYVLTGAYKNIGGTLTGIGTPSLIGGEDQAGWDCSFSSLGDQAIIVVTGAAGNNITWQATVSTFNAGA